ncbi:hypothetical protein ACFWAP_00885 [Streptomyces goshikiensis]|uniref:hypothetical protein n=1 Tax=Streptomyces goshikiensis TaxID=1942 RepID=UPI00364DA226
MAKGDYLEPHEVRVGIRVTHRFRKVTGVIDHISADGAFIWDGERYVLIKKDDQILLKDASVAHNSEIVHVELTGSSDSRRAARCKLCGWQSQPHTTAAEAKNAGAHHKENPEQFRAEQRWERWNKIRDGVRQYNEFESWWVTKRDEFRDEHGDIRDDLRAQYDKAAQEYDEKVSDVMSSLRDLVSELVDTVRLPA